MVGCSRAVAALTPSSRSLHQRSAPLIAFRVLKLTSLRRPQEVPQDSPLPGTMMNRQQKMEALLASPQDFIDIRAEKRNPRAPDFKHKSDQAVAIWLSDADPSTQASVEQMFGVSLSMCFCCLEPRHDTGGQGP